MKKKKNKYLMSTADPRFRSYLMSILRRASRYWKPSETCIEKTKLSRGVHLCPKCNKKFRRKDMRKDHIKPVIPITGFTTWDDAIYRLFETEDKYQALCYLCHDEKTKNENMERKLLRNKDDVLKLDED